MPRIRFDRICLLVAFVVLSACLLAAQSDNSNNSGKSWSSTSSQQDTSGVLNPTRSTASHHEDRSGSTDKNTIERLGVDGRYEPYLDTETQTTRVDAATTRTIQRTFGRDGDGRRTLVQVTEEETRTGSNGEQKQTRLTSNPDPNGQLQVVQREVSDTRRVGANAQETKTTVFSRDTSGSLSPVQQTEERQTRSNDKVTQFRKSVRVPDLNGNWQASEVREGTITKDGKNRTREESVLRPNADGQMAVAEKTVSKEADSAPGEQRSTVENYSTVVPGGIGDGGLHLNQRVTTVSRKDSSGSQRTDRQIEQPNPGAPSEAPRVTQKMIDIVRPGASGANETHVIQTIGSNGSLQTVWVDTAHSDKTPTVEVDTKAKAAPSIKVDTAGKAPAKK